MTLIIPFFRPWTARLLEEQSKLEFALLRNLHTVQNNEIPRRTNEGWDKDVKACLMGETSLGAVYLNCFGLLNKLHTVVASLVWILFIRYVS